MKTLPIALISFTVGAAVSAVATFFITKNKLQKSAEVYIQKQLEEDRKVLREKYDDVITVKEEEIKKDAVNEYCEEVRKQRKEYRENAAKYNTGVFTPFDPEDDKVKEALQKSRVVDNEPYQITEERHGEDGDMYDFKMLFYHPDAYDVADDTGALVDPADYIGSKLFNEFADDEDVDEMWVRNEEYGMDIYISKEVVSR